MRLIVRYSQPGLLGREFPSLSLSGIAFAYTLCQDVNLRVDTRIYGVAGEIGLVYTRQDGVYEMSDTGLLQGPQTPAKPVLQLYARARSFLLLRRSLQRVLLLERTPSLRSVRQITRSL